MSNDTEVSSIRALVQASQNTPYILTDKKGRDILLRPTGGGNYAADILTPADEVERKPLYAQANVSLQTTTSMITYLERFKTPQTILFANVDSDTIVASIDYHKPTGGAPGLRLHRAKLTLPTSIQWDTWINNNEQMVEQDDLAEFIQENHRDFKAPLGLDMLSMVLDMEKTAVMHVGRKMRRAGSDQGTHDKSIDIQGSELPPEWIISIPVYRGEEMVDVTAYAREKMHGAKNLYTYKLGLPERVKEDAFFAIASRIAEATGVPIVLGTMDG